MKIRVIHTGKVFVSPALPFKNTTKNPNPFQLTILSPYGRRNRVWLPVSAYLIEHPRAKILVDTSRHREINPEGKYNRRAQVKHMGLGHFLLNQGVVPEGQTVVEQLAELNISPKDLDFVIMTHLHTDHASGLAAVKVNCNGKFVLLFSDGGYAKKSRQKMIPPGTALDEELALKSLLRIRETSLSENCVESLANHDPDISPHEIILS